MAGSRSALGQARVADKIYIRNEFHSRHLMCMVIVAVRSGDLRDICPLSMSVLDTSLPSCVTWLPNPAKPGINSASASNLVV